MMSAPPDASIPRWAGSPEGLVELEWHAGPVPPQAIQFDAVGAAFVSPDQTPERNEKMHAHASSRPRAASTAPQAEAVVRFWREAGPKSWFAKDPEFDRRFREAFLPPHEAAARGELAGWTAIADGALGLVLLLDQFPRNAFRGTPRMYATDDLARHIADAAIRAGHDQGCEPDLRMFFYLPFAHSESTADQERSVALMAAIGHPDLPKAERHCEIVRRFGRFPHRNRILGRVTTAEEQRYLDEGGYAG
jgi:uncharacterized protein (DUF924 family)